ncbi:MAG TPA: VOC family protein [Acidimicrobiales bacterium]|nr:VOC family protein [Acidimicrobiales bacterium]
MSTSEESTPGSNVAPEANSLDMKLEVVVIPVSDVDRAKEFYRGLGWRLDADIVAGNVRLVQLTPPGSACSVQFGTNLVPAPPGSAQATYLVVPDITAARDDLARRGAEVTEVYHCPSGFACRFDEWAGDRADGAAGERASYGSFASFKDPDGNGWLLQEVTTRLPGRVSTSEVSFRTAGELAEALRRARAAHGEHERRIGEADASWPDWYAAYLVAEQSGAQLPR